MKYMLDEKEARQLKKQGYRVAAGEIVEACTMPEWIRKRAERIAAWAEEPSRVEEADRLYAEDRWTFGELKSLAMALGADRDPKVRELIEA